MLLLLQSIKIVCFRFMIIKSAYIQAEGMKKRTLSCDVNDDEYINKIIAYLNFGTEIVK